MGLISPYDSGKVEDACKTKASLLRMPSLVSWQRAAIGL
ncbi:Uncharacterised protein [Serratia entomophila]|nr:Uncharacterised protein [Serratia entomophila]